MEKYKTDEEIASEFDNMKVKRVRVNDSGKSGWIEIDFPNGEEHVGGGAAEIVDRWIQYDNGKIAFDFWYPESIYWVLVSLVKAECEKKGGENNGKQRNKVLS